MGDGGLELIVLQLMQQWNISGSVYDATTSGCDNAQRMRLSSVAYVIDRQVIFGHFKRFSIHSTGYPKREIREKMMGFR
jgi:hypothetical protein